MLSVVNPEGLLSPQSKTATIGQNVKFACYTIFHSIWTFNEGPLPQNVVTYRDNETLINYLLISDAQLYNTGIYICTYEKDNVIYKGEGVLQVVGKMCTFFITRPLILVSIVVITLNEQGLCDRCWYPYIWI